MGWTEAEYLNQRWTFIIALAQELIRRDKELKQHGGN